MGKYENRHKINCSWRETLSVEEAGRLLGISRSSAFQAAANGQLPVIKIGKRLLVPRAALERILGAPLSREVS